MCKKMSGKKRENSLFRRIAALTLNVLVPRLRVTVANDRHTIKKTWPIEMQTRRKINKRFLPNHRVAIYFGTLC